MKIPIGFIKASYEDATRDYCINHGAVRCRMTGLFYYPNSGNIVKCPIIREVESRSRYAKIQLLSSDPSVYIEMNLVDLIWEIMTEKEPSGKVSVKEGLFKGCTQWENLEMELPDFEMQSNFFALLEDPEKLNFVFKSPKEKKKFLKQTGTYKTLLLEIFGGPPKKFISGVDYLKNLKESRGNRKIRTLDDQKE